MIEIWDGEHWGRSATDAEGRFEFTIAKPDGGDGDAPRLDVYVFARGLLKHQLTRVYFPGHTPDDVDRTLVAEEEDGAFRFDIRLQGERQTLFFAH
jgi:protocatechuate 3,4-dioxygenase alpha subunit